MAGEWQTRTLRDFCRKPNGGIQTGPFGSQLHRADYVDAGVPVIMPTNIQAGRLADDGIARVSEAKADEIKRHRVRLGDIIFSRRGEVDKCAVVTEREIDWLCGTGCLLARVDPKLADARFVGYHISLPEIRAWLRQNAVGLVMPNLNTGILESIPIHAPSLIEQEQIADLLASLDAKVDLNRQMAATLEEMARAQFKSWFVDFHPVHAKAEGRDTGLCADIAALFPDSFDDEGLPDGWRSGSLDDLADTNSESWKASSRPEEVEYVDLSNCKWGNIDGTTQYKWEDAPSRARRVARAGDTIFGTVRPGNGSYAFVGREGLTVSTGFAVLRPKEVIYREMVYFAATSIDNIRWLEQLAAGHGGAYPAVNPDKVSATAVTVPCEKVAEAFSSTSADMIDRIESLKQETVELEQLRDTLLPKLLSGELRVADAESVIAAA